MLDYMGDPLGPQLTLPHYYQSSGVWEQVPIHVTRGVLANKAAILGFYGEIYANKFPKTFEILSSRDPRGLGELEDLL